MSDNQDIDDQIVSEAELDQLAGIPGGSTTDDSALTRAEILKRLAMPFPREAIESVKKGAKEYAFVNHAVITRRLNWATGNNWDWVPWKFEIRSDGNVIETVWDDNLRRRVPTGNDVPVAIMIGQLFIPGISDRGRTGMGVAALSAGSGEDAYKGANSDAIKNAAFRFGPGIQLYRADVEHLDEITLEPGMPTPPPAVRRSSKPEKAAVPASNADPVAGSNLDALLVIQKDRVGPVAMMEYTKANFGGKTRQNQLDTTEKQQLLDYCITLPDKPART